jgi:acetylornithine deacetylase/succinyl-diaminopimelate desuccinylase-like protein
MTDRREQLGTTSAHPDFAKAAAHITRERVRDTLMAMVDIQSSTGHERPMAEYMVDRMTHAGLETDLQLVDADRPNAVGHLRGRGGGRNLLFTGHMDTSYSGEESHLRGAGFKPTAVHEDGWIWGLGARNMKSGLAAALVAVEALAAAKIELNGDLSVAGVVGEIEKAPIEEFQGIDYSGYGSGSRHLVTHGVTADYAILGEPTRLRISPANMGCIWVRITVRGTIAHAALANRPENVNAIALMHELQSDLAGWMRDYEQRHDWLGEHPNVTMAAIRGGLPWRLARNPYECSLYLDIRMVPGQTIEAVKRDLRAFLGGFAERTRTATPSVHFYVTDPPNIVDDNSPVIASLAKAQAQEMVERPPHIIRRTGADAIHFTAYGIPCVSFGPGGRQHPSAGNRAMHAVGEHVPIEDVVTAARIYLAVALDLCGGPAA